MAYLTDAGDTVTFDSDGIAVGAVLIGLLIEGAAVLVVIPLVKLVRNWQRHRRQRIAPASV